MNKYLRSGHLEKIKTLKRWAHDHLPQKLSPVIDYTLGWLSPELLGTGFLIKSETDSSVIAEIPCFKTNQDFQSQVHLGLVVNAGQEMIRSYLQKNLVGMSYEFNKIEFKLNKKLNWTSDLILKMNISSEYFELQLIDFHKRKTSEFEFVIDIHVGESKKMDQISFKIELHKVNLIS